MPSEDRVDRLKNMTPSAIRAVHDLGAHLRAEAPERDLIALHFGEGDLGTPDFIVAAGAQALRDGAVDLALVVGSEGKGVRPLVTKQTDFAFAIPMSGDGIGSFNVAVAASLALYEVARQRTGAGSQSG